MVGAPDVLKGTCPVRGALDGNLPLRSGKALSFDSIGSPSYSPAQWSSWISRA